MKITGKTKLIGLLGRPIEHSISPLMHNQTFQDLNLPYAYLCFDCGEEELEDVVEGLKVLGAKGWNCTMPNKVKMAQLVDELSPVAKIVGAVNTVVNENGKLVGYNTDGFGYMMAVKDAGYDVIGKKMTIFGSGGAAASIIAQAAFEGVKEISVFCRFHSRHIEATTQMIDRLLSETKCDIKLFDYEENSMRREMEDSYLVVNGTSIGMEATINDSIVPDSSYFHPSMIVSDIIYYPEKTKFLQLAKKAGCETFNGYYMLLYQGAEAFKLWTGKEMNTERIKKLYFK